MLYLIGGVSRAGKGTLSQKLLEEEKIAYWSLDFLMSGAIHGAKNTPFEMDGEEPDRQKAHKLWPFIFPMLREIVVCHQRPYTVEGVCLLPSHIAFMQEQYPQKVRGCVLGYSSISIDEKMKYVMQNKGNPGEWLANESETYIRSHLEDFQRESHELQQECKVHNIPYFDTSSHFVEQLEKAKQYLLQP